MPKRYINPPTLFSSLPHGFSQAVVTRGATTIYISGQVAWDAQKQIVGGLDLRAQTRKALSNLQTAVEAAGGALRDVVALRLYVVNYRPEGAAAISMALREFFPEKQAPASTWVGVAALARPEFLIEIEAVAVLEGNRRRLMSKRSSNTTVARSRPRALRSTVMESLNSNIAC